MNKAFDTGLVWLRRDLRIDDNAALQLALASCRHVHCAFVFDSDILDPLPRAWLDAGGWADPGDVHRLLDRRLRAFLGWLRI